MHLGPAVKLDLKNWSDRLCCFCIVLHHLLPSSEVASECFTSTGDAFLVDFTQMSYAALV